MIHVGISGWTYAPWRGVFYPAGLSQKRELEYASRQLDTIEINGLFYSLQKPESYQSWAATTPDDFVFSVKGGRFITHMKKLRNIETALANFFASGVLCLGRKLGPILWQFPPNFRFKAELMEAFLDQLPHDSAAAAEVAQRHDERMKGRAWTEPVAKTAVRHAMEIRHESFLVPEFFAMLRRRKVAFVFADSAGLWPYTEDVTADFVYIRLHGAEELYASGYTDSALDWWAERIRAWAKGSEPGDARRCGPKAAARKAREVFVYFDNDAKVKAPEDARRLCERLGLKRPTPS